jgi:hypothetical protein
MLAHNHTDTTTPAAIPQPIDRSAPEERTSLIDDTAAWLATQLEWEARLHQLHQTHKRPCDAPSAPAPSHASDSTRDARACALATVNTDRADRRTVRRSWSQTKRGRRERNLDGTDRAKPAPRGSSLNGLSQRVAPNPAAVSRLHSLNGRPSVARRAKTPRLRVTALMVAAIIAGTGCTQGVAQQVSKKTPPWTAVCQQAANATAQLHRLQDLQFEQGMQSAWALVAGIHVQAADPFHTSIARLQHDANNAVRRCVSLHDSTPRGSPRAAEPEG